MTVNYTNWTVEKLNKEVNKIQRVIKTKETRDRKAALAKVLAVARKSGFELHELLQEPVKKGASAVRAGVKKTKKRGKVAPKYKNPADASVTWTGRGLQPLWVKDLISSGNLDDALITAISSSPSM